MPNTSTRYTTTVAPPYARVKVLPFTIEKMQDTEIGGCPALSFGGWASLETPDEDDEVIHVGFFDRYLPDFMRNPVMRWMHGRGDVQGKWTNVTPIAGKGYYADGLAIDFGGDEDKRRLNMLRTGAVKSLSVGFDGRYNDEFGTMEETPLPGRMRRLWHWMQNGRLFEISPCDLPCCPGASIELAKALGMRVEERPSGVAAAHGTLVVPDLSEPAGNPDATGTPSPKSADTTPDAAPPAPDPAAEHAKSDASVSFAANIAEEMAERQAWEILDGIWCAFHDTVRAILEVTGDRKPLIDQLGIDLAAELNRRMTVPQVPVTPPALVLSRAIEELTARKDDLPKQTEDERVLSNITRLANAAESLRNFSRHTAAQGGEPSALVVEAAARPIADLVEVVSKAGRVISEANRQLLLAAMAALQSLLDVAGGSEEPDSTDGCGQDDEDKPKARGGCECCARPPSASAISVTREATTEHQFAVPKEVG